MKKLLFGAAAGLAALTVGAGIAAAQTDDTVTEDTVVDDTTTDDTVADDPATTEVPADDGSTTDDTAGCEGRDGEGRRGSGPGQAPGSPDAPTDDTASTS